MGNIPLPKTPDVKSAAGFSQIDPSTGSAPYRAMAKFGASVIETGKTFHAFAEKKQKLDNEAAKSSLDLEVMRANGEIEDFALKNKHNPDSIRKFSTERMGKVWDNVDRKKVDEETYQQLNQNYALQSERTKIGVGNKITQIEVSNANQIFYNEAESYRRANEPQKAFDALKKMSITDADLYENMRKIFTEGVSTDVSNRIADAYTNTDVNALEDILEDLEAKEGGRFKEYEYTIKDNGKDIPAGGLGSGMRKKLIQEINSKVTQLEKSAIREARKAAKNYAVSGEPALSENAPPDLQEKYDDVLMSDAGKSNVGSQRYSDLQLEIGTERKLYMNVDNEGDGYEGDEGIRNKIWKEIENGGFTRAAQIQLMRSMFIVEDMRAGRDEDEGWGWWFDPNRPEYKNDIAQSLVSRYQRESDMIVEGLGDVSHTEYLLGFTDAMDELETKLESLSEDGVKEFMEKDVPKIWDDHVGRFIQQSLDEIEEF